MSAESPPQIINITPDLQHGIATLLEAAAAFGNGDPAIRAQGEAVFLHLRQDDNALSLSLAALQCVQDAFVHFQCLGVVLERTNSISLQSSPLSLHVVRDFLLAISVFYDQKVRSWPVYTCKRAFQAISALEKRLIGMQFQARQQHSDQVTKEHLDFLESHLIRPILQANANAQQAAFAAGLFATLLDEFSTSSNERLGTSSAATSSRQRNHKDHSGLTTLQCRLVRSFMQEQVFPPLTQSLLPLLSSSDISMPITSSLITIFEKISAWPFVINDPWAGLQSEVTLESLIALLAQDQSSAEDEDDEIAAQESSAMAMTASTRRIPDRLAGMLLNADVLNMLAGLLNTSMGVIAKETILCSSKLQRCLSALAISIPAANTSEVVFSSVQSSFLSIVAQLTSRAHSRGAQGGNLLLFIAQLLLKVVKTAGAIHRINQDPSNVLQNLSALTQKCLDFIRISRTTNSDDDDDNIPLLANELERVILSLWLSLSSAFTQPIEEHLFQGIVKPWIDARLHQSPENDEEAESEVGEETEPDDELFKETLTIVATLARKADVSASLRYLLGIARNVVDDFKLVYSSQASGNAINVKHLEARWEVIHWILLISGHLIADGNTGEIAQIPREIAAINPTNQNDVAEIIEILGLELPQLLLNARQDIPQSPQVIQSVLWFNARWIPSYLDVPSTEAIQQRLCSASGSRALSSVLSQIEHCMQIWLSDGDVILQISSVLRSLSLSNGVMDNLLAMHEFEKVVAIVIDKVSLLPTKTHKSLVSAMVTCIYASSPKQSPETFFQRIASAIETKLSSIVHQPNFQSVAISQRVDVIEGLSHALDLLDGLAASTQPKSARAVFGVLSRFFSTLTNLLIVYKGRGEVTTSILRIFATLVGALDLAFDVEEDISLQLHEALWQLFETIDPQAMLIGDSIASALEEDTPFEGLCLALQILSDLLLSSEGDLRRGLSAWLAPISKQQTGDLCFYGCSKVLPAMQNEVLAIPRVRDAIGKTICRLFFSYSHRIVGMVVHETLSQDNSMANGNAAAETKHCAELFSACVKLLSTCLTFDESNTVTDSLQAIESLSDGTRRLFEGASRATSDKAGLDHAKQFIARAILSPVLETISRALLIEPIAPSVMEGFVKTFDRVVTNLGAIYMNDVQQVLHTFLQTFCGSTSMDSTRLVASKGKTGVATISPAEDTRKRTAFANALNSLMQIALGKQSGNGVTLSKQDHALAIKTMCEVAWKGRGEVQSP